MTRTDGMIGQSLGHFEILAKLGEGGTGVVYKARDSHLDRLVAIKVLPSDRVADPDRRRRFVQEAKAASALNHPGIITIHDIAQHNGIDFIAMEYVEGHTLDHLIQRRGLPVGEAIGYAVQMADALAAAHAAGIVHRDLKPANVVVAANGRVKVLDFGLAKLIDRVQLAGDGDAPTMTLSGPATDRGVVVGTVAYMAPEQASGAQVDARADIFSFGAVLYEMVTGRRAFHGDSPLGTLTAVMREEPTPLRQLLADIPPELERVVTRCLRKDPERRWQSMADVKVALRELKEESDSGRLTATAAAGTRPTRTWSVLGLVALALVSTAAIATVLWRQRAADSPLASPAAFAAVPLTTYQGREREPTFSPDGNSVAFTWNGEAEENWDIYVKLIGPGPPLRLTTDPAADVSPAWSRDGRSIAFLRVLGDRTAVTLIPSLGGPERRVLEIPTSSVIGAGQCLSWSADSRTLVLSGPLAPGGAAVLTAVDVATGQTTSITGARPAGAGGDVLPSLSPDGRTLAFVRNRGIRSGELHVLSMSEAFSPVGEPRRLGPDGQFCHGVTWSADGNNLIVSLGNTGNVGLWSIPVNGPAPSTRLSSLGEESLQPAVAAQQRRLAYTRSTLDENIWQLPLAGPDLPHGPAVKVIASTRRDLNAQFSPDGTRIVFESVRSGMQEVWVADRDGSNVRQLTAFNGRRGGTPGWSPDGKWIVYDMRDDGPGDIYVIAGEGGAPRRVTTHPVDDLTPSWSRDGRWIYFGSRRTGRYEVWKVAPAGGEAIQVTTTGGVYAKESVDGRLLYHARVGQGLPSLWHIPVDGGEAVQVISQLASYGNFAVARDGIYFEAPDPKSFLGHDSFFNPFINPTASIDFLSFATGKVSRVTALSRPAGNGLDVSPDGRTLLFSQMDSFAEDLMLVENFR